MKKEQAPHVDQKYIQALLENDRGLIKEIYDKCVPMVVQLVRKNSGSTKDAQDVFQEALTDTYKKAASLKLYCPIEGYLYRVCRNIWLNQLKKKGKIRVTFSDVEPYHTNEADDFALEELDFEQQKRNLFNQMLEQLSERCKQYLRLSWEGNSMSEVATLMDVSYGFARKKKSECQGRLVKLVQASPEYKRLRFQMG